MSCRHVKMLQRALCNGVLKLGCSPVCTLPVATFLQHRDEEHSSHISSLCLGEINLLFDKVLGWYKTAENQPPFSFGRDHFLHLRTC